MRIGSGPLFSPRSLSAPTGLPSAVLLPPPPYTRCPDLRPALLRQGGNEQPPGMPAPSPPFLLCETEHPKANLSYLAICNGICSNCKCIPVLCLQKIYHPCPLLGPPLHPCRILDLFLLERNRSHLFITMR